MSSNAGRRMGWIGFAMLIALIVVGALLFLPHVTHAREAANRAACQGTLKQWGTIFSMYAKEWDGWYPRMQGPSPWLVDGISTAELGENCGAEEGFRLTPNPPSVLPEYATTLEVLRCPSLGHPDLKVIRDGCKYAGMPTRGDASFQYLGYAFVSDDGYESPQWIHKYGTSNLTLELQLTALFRPSGQMDALTTLEEREWADLLAQNIPIDKGLGNAGSAVVRRLCEGVMRFCITDINGPQKMMRGVPVMWDRVRAIEVARPGMTQPVPRLNHVPDGCNVLIEDGHVEFQRYSEEGKFPVNRVLPEVLWKAGWAAE